MSTIQSEWIEFAKALQEDEQPELMITDEQYGWFGEVMEFLKGDTHFPIPTGTECRNYPRAFFIILTDCPPFVNRWMDTWKDFKFDGQVEPTPIEQTFRMGIEMWKFHQLDSINNVMVSTLYGFHALEDLLHYGIGPLFRLKA